MEQRGQWEMVSCYGVETGRLEWAYRTAARYEKFEAGVGPRSTPTIDEGMVYALGALGHLACLDGATGKCLWEKDLLHESGMTPEDEAAAVPWGRAASPLVVGDRVIVPLGGRKGGRLVSLAAYDKRRGTLLWEGGNRQISYSSPALATLAGAEQVLIVNEDTVSRARPENRPAALGAPLAGPDQRRSERLPGRAGPARPGLRLQGIRRRGHAAAARSGGRRRFGTRRSSGGIRRC